MGGFRRYDRPAGSAAGGDRQAEEFARLNRALQAEAAERRRAQEDLGRMATAVAHAAEDIIVTDPDGTIVYVNPGFERITGYSREEAVGRTPRIVKSGEHDAAFYRHLWDTITSGRVWTGRLTNRRKDGTLVLEDATISPIPGPAGGIAGFVSVKRDVTRQVALETQLAAAQKMEAIGTLAGGIAHDFNNILAAITGYTELAAASAPEGSAQHRNLTRVLAACDRAAALVRQILAFSRSVPWDERPVQLKPLVNEALKLLRASLPATTEIRTDLASDAAVPADPSQLHQVLMNLCTNAHLALADRGGVLWIGLSDTEVGPGDGPPGLAPGRYVKLVVRDDGPGMEPEVLRRVFEPFFTTRPSGGGTGLGLAVVHGIVRETCGAIDVESEPGAGTEFTVWLPAAEPGPGRACREDPEDVSGRERVLFVDDEPFQVDLGREGLGRFGYRVTAFTDPRDALDRFRADPGAFDVVVSDLTMPGLTGDRFAREVLEIRPELPFVLCTGFSERVDEARAREIGVSALVMKPVLFRELAAAIRAAVDGRSASA